MKITEAEAKVMAAIGIRGDMSIAELSKATKLRQHICRNAFDSLLRREIISRRVVVNSCRVGFMIFGIWFSLKPSEAKIRSKFLRFLLESPAIAYVGEFEGEYSFKIDTYVRSFIELHKVLAELSGKFGNIFSKESSNCILYVIDYGYKFFAPQIKRNQETAIGMVKETITIDSIDHKILKALSTSGNLPNSIIARKLAVAAATLDYRIKKLREKKVIVGYHAVAQVPMIQSLGLVSYVHRLKLLKRDESTMKCISDFASSDPSVYTLTQNVGDFQIELCTTSESHKEEQRFCRRLEAELGDLIKEYSSVGIITHHKNNNYPFI